MKRGDQCRRGCDASSCAYFHSGPASNEGGSAIIGLWLDFGDRTSGVEGISKISWASRASSMVGLGEGDRDLGVFANGSESSGWPGGELKNPVLAC